MGKVRFMSQNQWNKTPNLEAWENMGLDCSAKVRMRGHVQILGELLPDIAGGQEVNADMQKLLKDLHVALQGSSVQGSPAKLSPEKQSGPQPVLIIHPG